MPSGVREKSTPVPVSARVWGEVGELSVRVRVPVRGPVAVGVKTIWREQEAFWARVPVQGDPPLVLGARMKSPVMAGAEREIGVVLEVRLVRVKRIGALLL